MQTRHLAELLPDAKFTALDINPPFVNKVEDWVREHNLGHRITAVVGDMTKPPVEPGSVDLVWCEGAAYMLGVGPALETWRNYGDYFSYALIVTQPA